MAAPRPQVALLRVVLATHNAHKLREVCELTAGAGFELVGLQEYPGVVLPPENGATFEENAIGKAIAAARQSGMVAIGDDSGLEVDALGGQPGILSARFAGPAASDEQNLALLLEKMKDVDDSRRTARFVCAIAMASPDGCVEVVRGVCEGRIARSPRGSNGFGYDPVFLIPQDGRTLAQFSPDEKNAISHRGQAIRRAIPILLRMTAATTQADKPL